MAQLKHTNSINDGFPSKYACRPSVHRGTKQNQSFDYIIEGLISVCRFGRDHLKEIQKCIGQVLSYYGDKDDQNHKILSGGTATVYKRLGSGYYLLITCGHNLIRLDDDEKQYPKSIFYLPQGEQMQEIRCKCIDWIHHEDYNLNLNHCPYDIGLILCHDVNSYYENVKINSCIDIASCKQNELSNCRIDGYPSRASGKLMGMGGDAVFHSKSGEWKYQDLFTYPGQSGSVIYKEKNKKYYIYGVHTFGNTESQKNRGVYLSQKHIQWFKEKENIMRRKVAKLDPSALGDKKEKSVKKYPSTLKELANTAPTTTVIQFSVGQRIQCIDDRYTSKWFDATITKVKNDKVFVIYDGYPEDFGQWVPKHEWKARIVVDKNRKPVKLLRKSDDSGRSIPNKATTFFVGQQILCIHNEHNKAEFASATISKVKNDKVFVVYDHSRSVQWVPKHEWSTRIRIYASRSSASQIPPRKI